MPTFPCPRCSSVNEYKRMPYSSGYDRCSTCNVALEWENDDGEIRITDYFVPDWCTVSPKSNRVLGPEIGWKATTGVLRLYAFFRFPGAKKKLRKKQIYDGMLER